MRKIKYIIVILFLMIIGKSFAITSNQLKNARVSSRDWFEDYSLASNFTSKRSAISDFTELFFNNQILIHNDCFAIDNYDFTNTDISVEGYTQLRTDNNFAFSMLHTIENITAKSEQLIDNNTIEYIFRFDKIVWFQEKDNYNDDRYEYPKINLEYEVTLNYNIKNNVTKATSFKIVKDIAPFVVLYSKVKSSENNSQERAEHSITTLKKIQQICQDNSTILIKSNYQKTDFNDKIYTIKADTIKNSIGFGVFGSKGNFSTKLTLDDSFNTNKNEAINAGAFLKYYRQLLLKNNNRIGLDLGIKFNWQNYNFTANYTDSYNSVDPDGGKYVRMINITNYNEIISSCYIGIPIGARYDYFINEKFSLFSTLGVELMSEISNNTSAKATTTYSGYYDWLFDVVIDQNGIYDFGTYELNKKTNSNLPKNRFELNAYAGIGCGYFISKNLTIDIYALYNTTIFNTLNKRSDYHLTTKDGDWNSSYFVFGKTYKNLFNFQIQLNYHF